MGRFLLVFAYVAITVYALVDLARSPSEKVRVMPKLLWAVIIFAFGALGAGVWFLFGRPRAEFPPSGGGGGNWGRPSGPLPPDDDPEFLKRLDEQSWAAKMERLRREREKGQASPGRPESGGSGAESPPDPVQP